MTKEKSQRLRFLISELNYDKELIYRMERFLVSLQEGKIAPVPGHEDFANFILDMIDHSYV